MHDRRPILALHAAGHPIRAIARDLGIDRNTVRRAIDPNRPLTYHRRSPLADVEPEIRGVLHRWPHMPATGVARRLGYTGGMTQFSRRVHVIRREVLYGAS